MYRSQFWTMRQFAGFGTPRQTNARFRFLLEKGETGLSTAFDLPTLMGLDNDDPLRRRRGRPARGRGRYDRGRPAALRRHRPRPGLGVPDDQRPGNSRHGLRLRPRPGPGPGPAAVAGHDPENDILKEYHAQTSSSSRPSPPCGWWST